MTSILYAINIGTLATWMSVASFGVVGIGISGNGDDLTSAAKAKDPYADLEAIALTDVFTPDQDLAAQTTDTGTTGELNSDQADVPFAEQETLPTPPDMPEVAETTPLPEIPDMPDTTPSSSDFVQAAPTKKRPVCKTNAKEATRSNMPTSATGGSPNGKVGATGKVGNGGQNGGNGMSDAKRLANGRMSKPPYPSELKSKGQGGVVGVEIIVDGEGRVARVTVIKPSPWASLNESTKNHIERNWKFPKTGTQSKFTRAIKFEITN